MLNESEKELIDTLNKKIELLSSKVETQQIIITGLLNCVLNSEQVDASLFFSAARMELDKLPLQSDSLHLHRDAIQKLVDRLQQS